MAIISSILPVRGIVYIEFDDGRRLCVRKKDVSALSLASGSEYDYEALKSVLCRAQLGDAYESALSSLDVCARTEKQIRDKLKAKGYLNDIISAVCERLKQARLIDDKDYAARVVQASALSGRGKYAVKRKLISKGISACDAEDALETLTDEAQAESAYNEARRLLRKYESLLPRDLKNKLSQALARRGYSWDSIEAALGRLISDQD